MVQLKVKVLRFEFGVIALRIGVNIPAKAQVLEMLRHDQLMLGYHIQIRVHAVVIALPVIVKCLTLDHTLPEHDKIRLDMLRSKAILDFALSIFCGIPGSHAPKVHSSGCHIEKHGVKRGNWPKECIIEQHNLIVLPDLFPATERNQALLEGCSIQSTVFPDKQVIAAPLQTLTVRIVQLCIADNHQPGHIGPQCLQKIGHIAVNGALGVVENEDGQASKIVVQFYQILSRQYGCPHFPVFSARAIGAIILLRLSRLMESILRPQLQTHGCRAKY